ncbi:hypothetical protein ACIHFE_12705 [Streptomyces sp. NPDC052396]|uniref:hypothetical protein n=1 Tax=Streptomyces sp. NPDC052396 TaxID=3365689 RepID=UPI0037D03235
MSSPQPQYPSQPQQPDQQPPGGFGPPATWGPEGSGHAQPTMFAQPAVPGAGAGAPVPPPGAPGVPGGAPVPPPAPGVPGGARGQQPGAGVAAAPTMVGGAPVPPPGAPGAPGGSPVPPPGAAMAAAPTMVGGAPISPAGPGMPGAGHPGAPGAPYAGGAPVPPPGAGQYMPGMPAGGGNGSGSGRPRSRTWLAAVGGVVALAVIGGGVFYALKGGDKKDDKKADGKSTVASAPAQPSGQPKGQDQPGNPQGQQAALPAGWQPQTNDAHGFGYAVPGKADKWQVLPTETMLSYNENGKPVVAMRGTTNYWEGGCASSPNPDAIGEAGKGQLATIGVTGGGREGTLQSNARNWAGNWGVMAYGGTGATKPKIEVGQATPWKHNGIEGYTATAKVVVTHRPSPCVPPTAIVKTIAQKLPNGTFHGWVIYADQGVPHALTEAKIDEIMNTVHPAKS